METWFLNHVLGLSLLVLHLGLPGPLRAGTPSNNSTNTATPALDDSVATDEVRSMENSATSNSYSSETLTPSQRNLLLRHAAETHAATAGNFGKSSECEACSGKCCTMIEKISFSFRPVEVR